MKNTVSIRIDNPLLTSIGNMNGYLPDMAKMDYYLVVNGEEAKITRNMAYGITQFMDEYRDNLKDKVREVLEEI